MFMQAPNTFVEDGGRMKIGLSKSLNRNIRDLKLHGRRALIAEPRKTLARRHRWKAETAGTSHASSSSEVNDDGSPSSSWNSSSDHSHKQNSIVSSNRLEGGPSLIQGLDWEELLSTPEPEIFGPRARSASDANVLRRKGHLKEQDKFIQFMMDMHQTHTCLEVMEKVEKWVEEHRATPRTSRISRMVPTLGSFFTPLRLVDAFWEYDQFFALSRRQYVPPNFAELRHILNIAQLHASAETLKLITFDADGTLYADGAHMQHDNDMIRLIISLMKCGVHVAIVTAAGYANAPERFEQRVEGLLAAFRALKLPQSITDRFHIMGGECNYLLRVEGETMRLEFVPDADWKSQYMMEWKEKDINGLLSDAEALLLEGAERLRLPVSVIRKERAVGVVPEAPTIYEVLEDLAISVQSGLHSSLPFCAFNGGNDVFVDVGNKSLGLEALMNHLGFSPSEVLHVGDRFTDSGNDSATRDCCSILWVANPEETYFFINLMLQDVLRIWGNA